MDKKNFDFVLRAFDYDVSKRWYLEAVIDGKRVRKYGNINRFHTVGERMKAADVLAAKLAQAPPPRSLSVASFDWLEKNRFRWRRKTYQTIKSKVSVFWAWIGARPLTSSLMAAFLLHLGASGRSFTTHNNYLRVLRMLNTECLKIDGLFADTRPLRAEPVPAKYFTRAQVDFLKSKFAAENEEVGLVVQFIFYCFIRPAELRLLRVSDVVLDEGRILVRADISKNRKEQYIAIPSAFRLALSAALLGRAPSEYIFGGSHSRRKDFHARKHQEILKKWGFDVSRYKLYSWKHTGAVFAVRAGVGLKDLQIQLRHHSLDQVNSYLRQLGASDLDQLAEKFPSF